MTEYSDVDISDYNIWKNNTFTVHFFKIIEKCKKDAENYVLSCEKFNITEYFKINYYKGMIDFCEKITSSINGEYLIDEIKRGKDNA